MKNKKEIMDKTTYKTNECLLYLMACALNGAPADEKALAGVDLVQLLGAARSHTVGAMVCMALEKTEAFSGAPEEIRKQWLDAKNKAIRKNMLLDAERGAILHRLEEAGIWYMPLKGCILKDWYPKPGMREMADNDILIDPSGQEQVREIFRQRGYTVIYYQKGIHDVYKKPPIYNFEMHTALFHKQYVDFAAEYSDVKEQLLPMEGTKYGFRFSPEDFYVYILAHAYKHFQLSGIGVRTLADIYVMNRQLHSIMNRDDVEKKLDALHVTDYARSSQILADKLFSSARPLAEVSLTEEEEKMLLYQLSSSTHGTANHLVGNKLHRLQEGKNGSFRLKLKYCRMRLFPGRDWCKDVYPVIYNHPWLLPFFWIWRIVKRFQLNRRGIQRELSALKSYKEE